nr:MAG TPA: restriction enzyme [Caudoviricetes sp.]
MNKNDTNNNITIKKNNMWETSPTIASLLLDKNDGYRYTKNSSKKVWWKCPHCGEHLYKIIFNVSRRGLCCNKCSDGISFPNRFMYNVLSQINVNFKTEYIIKGKNYRYDFYIPCFNLIIEMQGRQHYDGWNKVGISKENIQKNDELKQKFAINSGISEYITINAKESNRDFIKENILNSSLKKYFDFSIIDWDKCLMNSSKSMVCVCAEYYNSGMSTSEISQKINYSKQSVLTWLKIGNELNLCNWIPSKGFLKDNKEIILLNNKKIYESIKSAAKDTNQDYKNISAVCNGKRNYSGVINGEPLVWMFLDDYNNKNVKNKIVSDTYISHTNGIVVNQYTIDGKFVNTFTTIKEAENATGITTIKNACAKRVYSAGGYRWYYVDDEKQPNKNKIVGKPRNYGDDKVYTEKGLKLKSITDDESKCVVIDCFDKYGHLLKTCYGYHDAMSYSGIKENTIYKSCVGNNLPIGDYVFRYHNDSFYKYYYPKAFLKYINVYKQDNNEFVGTFYSIKKASTALGGIDESDISKILKKERKTSHGYCFYYACDDSQPDKSKIISETNYIDVLMEAA